MYLRKKGNSTDARWMLYIATGHWPQIRVSLINSLQEPSILLANVSGLVKRTCSLPFKTVEILLNVLDVDFEVLKNEIPVFLCRLRITWHEWPHWRDAGICVCSVGIDQRQNYSPRKSRTAQPEVSQTPYFLE